MWTARWGRGPRRPDGAGVGVPGRVPQFRAAGDRPPIPIQSGRIPQCRGNRRPGRGGGDTEPADEHGAKRVESTLDEPFPGLRSRPGRSRFGDVRVGRSSRLTAWVGGWSTANMRNRPGAVRYADESSPAPGITYWSIPELRRIGRASANPAPEHRLGARDDRHRVGIVEPVAGWRFLGAVAGQLRGEGVEEEVRLGIDQQIGCPRAGTREGGLADAGTISGKLGRVRSVTVPIRFRAYHEIESSTRRRAFRPGCGHSGHGRPVRPGGHCGRFRVSRVPGMIRQVRVCPTVFWRR